jgi:glycine betaine/proline transport system ATP-binding protein
MFMSKVEVKGLYKIFGATPKKILPMIEKGMSKGEILKSTGHGVGVNNANFHVKEGETFVVMGLSGSGKSTLIRCLNRLIEPTFGEILIDGKNIVECGKEELMEIRRKKIAMVFQNFALLPHRTVLSNVAYGLEIQKVDVYERRKTAYEMLELVGLKGYEESYPSQLSGGMQQRVGLARALATDPDILLMDEAFSALDPLIRKEMQNELLNLQSKMKKTIIFITHDLDEALKIGDRIAIMKDGNIVQIDAPEEILKNPADDYVREFVQDVNRAKIVTAATIMQTPDTVVYSKDGARVAVRKMKEASISSIFITDKEHHLKGIVTIDEATALLKSDQDNLESIINENVNTVSPDTAIEDLMQYFINSKYPVVVTDEENRMLGIIFKVSVLAGILGKDIEHV